MNARDAIWRAVFDDSGDCYSASAAPATADALTKRIMAAIESAGYALVAATGADPVAHRMTVAQLHAIVVSQGERLTALENEVGFPPKT